MKEQPKVSVIIPVYNAEKYLRQCLDSVVNQTLKDIEIICVNDGSTDESLNILHEYRDLRIKVFCQANAGSGPARNFALKKSQGEFVAFMDADDWYPEKETLEKLYAAATKNNVLICGGSFSIWRESEKVYVTTFGKNYFGYTFDKDGIVHFSDYQFDYGYHRFLYSRKFLHEKHISFPDYRRFQDPPFFVKAMISAEKFYAITDITYCYRPQNRAGMIKQDRIKLLDLMRGLTENLRLSREYGLEKLHRLTLTRCEEDYLDALVSVRHSNDDELLDALININQELDRDMIGIKRTYVIKSLREITFGRTDADVELNALRNSLSYRIGRFITFIPRKMRGMIRCLKENGIKYTLHRLNEKLLNKRN